MDKLYDPNYISLTYLRGFTWEDNELHGAYYNRNICKKVLYCFTVQKGIRKHIC